MEISVLSYFALALQFSLGIVFLLSSSSKIRQPLAFTESVVEYKILPTPVAKLFGFALIPLEAFLAISFLVGWQINTALSLAAVLLSSFLIAAAINLKRGRNVPCGCLGNAKELISSHTLARLFLLLVITLLLIAFRTTRSISSFGFAMAITNVSTLIYFIQTLFLSIFLVLLSAWILHMPELITLGRYLRHSQLPMRNATDKSIQEG